MRIHGVSVGRSKDTEAAAHAGTLLLTLSLAALTPAQALAQDISDACQFAASLYAWLPDIAGKASFGADRTVPISVDVETILDNLEMVGQGQFGLQKGRWGAFTDVIYLGVGASKSQTRTLSI